MRKTQVKSKKNKVLYGWKNESLFEKTKWFLSLSPTQRYVAMVSMQELFCILNPVSKSEKDARRSFKTIQVLG